MAVLEKTNKQSTATTATPQREDFLAHPDQFPKRHIGPDATQTKEMLALLSRPSLDVLIDEAVPKQIRLQKALRLPEAVGEYEVLGQLKTIASQNQIFKSYIGMGYYDCITPAVIQRNILENPGWYTQYTPYQAEISQGRLEALLNFQTMVTDLTALDIANASLLDESTAAAEAMTMCYALKDGRNVFFVAEDCHPQNIDVVKTRAKALGIEVVVGDVSEFELNDKVFGVLLQHPNTYGGFFDYTEFIAEVHKGGAMVTMATDLLALTLLKTPGEMGVDIAVGSAQRFGVPLGYGGPHAAFFATRDAFKRHMPGRIVGVSKDSRGKPALRLSLQTREQHIRREKATSNICTAQALLANIASMYACYHGPEGLKAIAKRVHAIAEHFSGAVMAKGLTVDYGEFFDTVGVECGSAKKREEITRRGLERGVNLRTYGEDGIAVAFDETTDAAALSQLISIFTGKPSEPVIFEKSIDKMELGIRDHLLRTTPFLTHKVFNSYHSETEMLRYIKRLESRDLSLTTSMIPLGSCTMKLNAAIEMLPITWPEFGKLHPFAPLNQTKGYQTIFKQLEDWLAEITGFAGISLQPNAGSQGEYAGLLVIRAHHEHRGEAHRDICLIPTSAHGTNPASAVMAGMKVVAVACDKDGNIDLPDLRAKAAAHKNELAALMVTYPSTHGVFEETIKEICEIIHANGGQVYMDGANMNAQVGLCRPGDMGADVCHLNLHKTFCIPHGGGGPGMGPIGVAAHLVKFLPGHPVVKMDGEHLIGAVSAAPWGSASILIISWVYIALMGSKGLTDATKYAILNANYIATRLAPYFPVLYKGHGGLVAHECILDLRAFKSVTVEDVAKRLMDYGFHAPTISWPVPGTMMIEPTESESKGELDRLCDALISIHGEIQAIESGAVDKQNNLLKGAPHTADMIAADNWSKAYSRQQAAYPAKWLFEHKFWPYVGRIDNVYGDRNPVCTCVGMDEYQA